jgi:dinuclear metal center YbgI/SA1388 family protein
MDRDEVVATLEQIAPPSLAEEYDKGRIGLVVEGSREVRKVSCALDATADVVDQAIASGSEMLVVHHTPIWTPVTMVRGELAALLSAVLGADLNIYVLHSNFDRAPGGVNDTLADLLGMTDRKPLQIGLTGACELNLEAIRTKIRCPLRVWGRVEEIHSLAVVGGSGFDPALISEAAVRGVDAFLSAEMKHSVARALPVPCIEATHYALESPGMAALAKRLNWTFLDDPPVVMWVP